MSDTETKSIMPEKFRKGYKGTPADDFVRVLMDKSVQVSETKERVIKSKDDEGNVTEKTVNSTSVSVNVDALFDLMAKNNIDISKHAGNRGNSVVAGRLKMTFANMLRGAARKRHGLYNGDGEWVDAPAEWLASQGAPEAPTHDHDGKRIPKAKPAEDGEAAAA